MQVRVTQRGFLYWIRHPGEVIDIAEEFFEKEWMEKIEGKEPEPAPEPPPADDAHVEVGSSLFSDPTKLKMPDLPETTLEIK